MHGKSPSTDSKKIYEDNNASLRAQENSILKTNNSINMASNPQNNDSYGPTINNALS